MMLSSPGYDEMDRGSFLVVGCGVKKMSQGSSAWLLAKRWQRNLLTCIPVPPILRLRGPVEVRSAEWLTGWVVHPFRSPCSKWSGWARWTRSRRRTRERAAKPSGRSERQEGRPCTRYRQRVTCGGVGVAVPRRAESARAPHATRRSCVLRLGRRWCVRTRCQSLSLSESRCWAGSSNRPGGDRALLLLPAWPRTELYPGRVTQMGCQNMGMGCPFDGSIKAD
jgi:hypothetical protein